ncbi:hypothetical protein SLS57_008607 [Botryosphaeria dothidea]
MRTAAETIAKLTESFPLTLVGYLILSMAKMKAPRNFTFHIAIYGNRQDANAIGTLLGASGLYIQPPHGFQSKVPYFNPQYLRRPGDEDYIAYFSPQFSTTLSTAFSEDDPLRYQVLEVFNNAHGPSIYTSVKPSPRLKTPLKEHQIKALSMMIEKEGGALENTQFDKMWIPITQLDGSIRYKNTISEVFQPDKPSLCFGGLLADNIVAEQDPHPRNTTLIVTPLSLLASWEEQINRHIHPNMISYHVYHGPGKQKPEHELKNYDVVLTTYDTLAAEGRKHHSKSIMEVKGIAALEWRRVVLDEGNLLYP